MQEYYPLFDSHKHVICFNCNGLIGENGKPIFFDFPWGSYGMKCIKCNMSTYYDVKG